MAERKALVLRIADGVIEELPSGDTLTGATGGSGAVILNGTVDPTTEGSDGDFYINTTTSTLFGPKATTWPAGVPLIGADGADGADGAAGADGADGSNGVGVPVGGTAGQILAKIDGTDYNTEWINAPEGGSTPVADTTDYVNEGGTGNRTAIITCTYRNGGASPAAMPAMVDGATASNAFYFGGGGFDRDLTFVFAEGKGIDEFKWYQSGSQTHGGWKMQGSNDGTNWTDISSEFTLGGASPSTHVMDLYDGTLYTQYRLIGVSGNADVGPWIYEIEFKIAGEAPVAPPVENLGDLGDVTVAGATEGQVLKKTASGYAFSDESGGTTLPTITAGDAGKALVVNQTEDGYEYASVSGQITTDLTIQNGGFETGDLTGWTADGNSPSVEARVGGTGTWSSEFDETYGGYVLAGGLFASSGAHQDIDVTNYAAESGSVYTISSTIAVEDTGTADAITFTITLLDSGDGTVATDSKTITGPADTMDLSDLVVTGDGTEVTLRISVAFTRGGSGSYINAALDSVSGSVTYIQASGGVAGSGSVPIGIAAFTPPIEADWSFLNDGGATALTAAYNTTNKSVDIVKAGGSATHMAVADLNEAGDWTRIFRANFRRPKGNYAAIGFLTRHVSNAKMHAIVQFAGNNTWYQQLRNGTTFASEASIAYPSIVDFPSDSDIYFKISYVSSTTTLTYFYSVDGLNWVKINLDYNPVSGHLGAAPDQVGILVQTTSINASDRVMMSLKGFDTEQQEPLLAGGGVTTGTGGTGASSMEELTDTQIVKANLGASHTGQPIVWDNDLEKFVVAAPGFDTMKLGGGRELLFADLDMGTSSFLSLVLDESTYNIDEYDEIEVILYGANNSLTLEISADGGTTADNIRRWERYADATASTSLHTQTRLGSGVGTEAGAYVIATIKNHSDPTIPTTVESFGHSTTTALNAMQSYAIADTIQKHNALVFSMNNDTNATSGKLLIVGVKKSRQPLEYSGLLSAAWSAGATAIAGATAGMKVRAGTAGAVYLVGGTNAADTDFQVEDSSATVIATGTVTAGQTSAVLTASGENTITGPITVKGVDAGDSGVSAYVVIRGELA